MPLIVKFSNTTSTPTQSQILPNATSRNDGVMTKEQAAKLEAVVAGTTVLAPLNEDIPAPTNSGSLTDISTTGGGQIIVTVPAGVTTLRASYGGPRLVANPGSDTANLVKGVLVVADTAVPGFAGVLTPNDDGTYDVTPGQELLIFGAVANVFNEAPKVAFAAFWSVEFTYLFE